MTEDEWAKLMDNARWVASTTGFRGRVVGLPHKTRRGAWRYVVRASVKLINPHADGSTLRVPR